MMNKKQLLRLGVPEDCVPAAVRCLHESARNKALRQVKPKQLIPRIVARPHDFVDHDCFAELARRCRRAREATRRAGTDRLSPVG